MESSRGGIASAQDANPFESLLTSTVPVRFLPGEGTGEMDDSEVITAKRKLDSDTGNISTVEENPATTLPKSAMNKEGSTFIGWQPLDDSVILPDEAKLNGLTYLADTDGDGKEEIFDLSNSVSDGKLVLVAQYQENGKTDSGKRQDAGDVEPTTASRRFEASNPEDGNTTNNERGFDSIPDMLHTPTAKNEMKIGSLQNTKASISPLTLTSPLADVAPEDNPSQDGSTIEKIEAYWILAGATGNEGDTKETLVLNPTANSPQTAKFRIDLSTSGQFSYNPGDIEITFPRHVFNDRFGKETGTLEYSVPADPSVKGTFNYRIVGENVVLTNTKKLSAATQSYFEFSFTNLMPVDIFSGAVHDGLQARVTITTHEGNIISKTSNELKAIINTDEVVTNASKRGAAYEYLPASWKDYVKLPSGFNPNDYVFVDWYTYAYIKGNQPFTMAIEDPMLDDGILLGGTLKDQAGNEVYQSDNIFTGWRSDGYSFYHHMYVAYPKDKFPPKVGGEVHNTVSYTLTSTDTKHVTTAKASAKLGFIPFEYEKPTGHFMVHKWGVDEGGSYRGSGTSIYDGHIGSYNYALNQLRDGKDTEIEYTVLSKNMPYPWTCEAGFELSEENSEHCGKLGVDFEITDHDTYWYNDFKNALTKDDFEFSRIRVGDTTMYRFGRLTQAGLGYDKTDTSKVSWVPAGSWGYNKSDEAEVPAYTVYGKRGESGEWFEVAKVTWAGHTPTITATDGSGASVEGRDIILPAGVTDWKWNYTTTEAGHYLYMHPVVKLRANSKAVQYVQQIMDESNADTPASLAGNTATMVASQESKDIVTLHADGQDKLEGVAQGSWLVKTGEKTGNNPDKGSVGVHYDVKVYNQSNLKVSSTYDTALKAGAIKEDPSGTYWDLLPKGLYVKLDSIKVDGDSTIQSVKTHPNWKDSGRTMLEVAITHRNNKKLLSQSQGGLGGGYGDTRTLSFDAEYSWKDIKDYGATLTNAVAYKSDNQQLGTVNGLKGEPGNPDAGNNTYSQQLAESDRSLMTGITNNTDPSWLYGGATFTVNANTSATGSLSKYVDTLGSNNWGTGLKVNHEQLTVPNGGSYRYRLRTMNEDKTVTSNIVLYDDIEGYAITADKTVGDPEDTPGAERWEGAFRGVDTSQLEAMGVSPVIYYAIGHHELTQYKWGESDSDAKQDMPNLADGNVWSTVPPADLSTVKTIAIDCSRKKDGTPFSLGQGESLTAIIHMQAPTGEYAQDRIKAKAHAYNNVYMSSVQTAVESGEKSTHYIHHDYTKIGLKPYALKVAKNWDDKNNQDGKRPESVTVHLTRNGRACQGDECGAGNGQDVVLDKDNNWTHTWEYLDWAQPDGTVNDWNVQETQVPEGYKSSVRILSAENDETIVADATLTNTHLPEKTELRGQKQWRGDDEAQRPQTVTVDLYKDGKLFKSATTDAAHQWQYEFNGLDKYRDHGTEIKYEVKERDYVPGYATSVEGTNLVNTWHPFADLTLTKRTINQSEGQKDRDFTFTFELYDLEANPIDGDFTWQKHDGEGKETGTGTIQHGGQFTLRSNESITFKQLPSESRYRIREDRMAGYTLTATSKLEGMLQAGKNVEDATATNTYKAKGSAAVEARKTVENATLKRGQFTFELVDKDGKTVRSTVNDKDGNIRFGALEFDETQIGTYEYTIREKNDNKPGWTYDQHEAKVTILVEDNGDGTLKTTVTYPAQDTAFNNEYHAEGAVYLTAHKTMVGADLTEGQFTFAVLGKDGKEIVRASNKADGTVEFPAIKYTEKDIDREKDDNNWRDYQIVEIKGNDNTIVYDEHKSDVRVHLIDNGDGTITAETHVQDPNTLEWKNTLAPGDLTIQKIATGTNADPNAMFTFDIQLTPPEGVQIKDGDYRISYEPITKYSHTPNVNDAGVQKGGYGNNRNLNEVVTLPGAQALDVTITYQTESTNFDWVCLWEGNHPGYTAYNNHLTALEGKLGGGVKTTKTFTIKGDTVTFGFRSDGSTDDYYGYYATVRYGYIDTKQAGATATNNMSQSGDVPTGSLQQIEAPETLAIADDKEPTVPPVSEDIADNGLEYETPVAAPLAYADIATGTWGTCPWRIDANGKLIIEPGTAESLNGNYNGSPWYAYRTQIKSAEIQNGVNTGSVTNMAYLFYQCKNLQSLDVRGFDTSNVTDMGDMFSGCSGLTSLDVSGFDTSNVTNMRTMFWGCSGLRSLDVSGFDTSNVTNMGTMFWGCSGLRSLDVSGFDTSKVTSMDSMFSGCSGLTSLDVSGFDTGDVKYIGSMFNGCSKLTSLVVKHFNMSNVVDMTLMFGGCSGLTTLDLSGWDVRKVDNLSATFLQCKNLESISLDGWKTSSLRYLNATFAGCVKLKDLDISKLDTANVIDMSETFSGCSHLTVLDVSKWNTRNVTSMSAMFSDCSGLTSLDVSRFDTSHVTNMRSMFNGCSGLTSLDLSGFDTSKTTSMENIFQNDKKLKKIRIGEKWFASPASTNADTYPPTDGLWVDEGETIDSARWDAIAKNTARPAGWYYLQASIHFEPNGANGQMADMNIHSSEDVQLSSSTFSMYGYEFNGWNTTPDGSGQSYQNEGIVFSGNWSYSNLSLTLYAQWKKKDLQVPITNGKLTVEIPAGYQAVITGLPGGTTYTVTEQSKPGWVQTGATGTTGSIHPSEHPVAAFTNDYQTGKVQASLNFTKLMDGHTPTDGKFEFTLSENGNVLQTVHNSQASLGFKPITYEHAGEHDYTIKETKGNDSAVQYDSTELTAHVSVKDDGKGNLSATVTYGKNGQIFRNTSSPGVLKLMKAVTGTSSTDKTFTFHVTLTDKDGKPLDGTYSGIVFENGSADITVTAGTPKEIQGLPAGTRYEVSEPSEHIPAGYQNMTGSVIGSVEAAQTVQAVIENVYSARGDFTLDARKTFDRDLTAGRFEFEMLDQDKKVVATASNDSLGGVRFDPIEYTQPGTYTYTVREVDTKEKGVVYDKGVKTVTVNVTDNGDGTLNAVLDEKTTAPEFVNKTAPGNVSVTKRVTGTDKTVNTAFGFVLHLTGPDGKPVEGEYNATITTGSQIDTIKVGHGSEFQLKQNGRLDVQGLPADTVVRAEEKTSPGFTQAEQTVDSVVVPAGDSAAIEITNVYSAEGVLALSAKKEFVGGSLTDTSFKFEIRDDKGTVVSTGKSDKDGNVKFTPIKYLEGDVGEDYRYTMVEVNDKQAAIAYDTTQHSFTVHVEDKGDGNLEPQITWDNKEDEDGVRFTNYVTYTLPTTGGSGQHHMLAGLLALILALVFLYIYERRKESV